MNAPVTVLISTFNRAEYIAEALRGILNQTARPQQIIVINDGSTDKTEASLKEFQEHITYIKQENSGKSAALNKALPLVSGEYIWIFDDDDVPFPDALERHLSALDRKTDAGFTYSPMHPATTGPDKKLVPLQAQVLPEIEQNCFFPKLLEGCFMYQQGSLVRTSCFRDVGEYRTDLLRSLDYEYMLRLARRFPSVRIEQPTFYLREHEGQRGTLGARFNANEKLQHWYRYDQIIFQELYKDLALWEYLPHAPGSTLPDSYNIDLALMTRASIMGFRGMWKEAIDDLRQLINRDGLLKITNKDRVYLLDKMFDNSKAVKELAKNIENYKNLMNLSTSVNRQYFAFKSARKLLPSMTLALRNFKIFELFSLGGAIIRISGLKAAVTAVLHKFGWYEAPGPIMK